MYIAPGEAKRNPGLDKKRIPSPVGATQLAMMLTRANPAISDLHKSKCYILPIGPRSLNRMRILLVFAILICGLFAPMTANVSATEWFDNYPATASWPEQQTRLGNFAIFLDQNPTMIGYILYSGGPKVSKTKVSRIAERSRVFVIKSFKIDPQRVQIIYKPDLIGESEIVLQPVDRKVIDPFHSK